MAFYSRSAREDISRRNIRTVTSESPYNSAAVPIQLDDLMKMMQDQKEAVKACLTENKKLNNKVANLQESVDKLKEGGGRKKTPLNYR